MGFRQQQALLIALPMYVNQVRLYQFQQADIGDLILSTPALAPLREARPDAHITLLTTAHSVPVIAGTNLVDEIITFDKKQFNGSRAFFQPANLRRVFNLQCEMAGALCWRGFGLFC